MANFQPAKDRKKKSFSETIVWHFGVTKTFDNQDGLFGNFLKGTETTKLHQIQIYCYELIY